MAHEKFHYKSLEEVQAKAAELGLSLPFAADTSALTKPLTVRNITFPNRMGIAPMEGADSTPDGAPSEYTLRRYVNEAIGGSAVIWFEAISIVEEGRSSKTQLLLTRETLDAYKAFTAAIKEAGLKTNGFAPYLIMQANHSGRYSNPDNKPAPMIAYRHPELEQYRASNNANLQCKESIEAAVREHFDGMYLSHDAAKGVIETYGMERVAMVLANTVQLQDWDGRYSRRNKEWAKTIPNENPETVRCGYVLNSHPAVLDGFIDLVREEQQRSRTQGEKLQPSRPSVRDKLKQELPAHKPAAPKKREPER